MGRRRKTPVSLGGSTVVASIPEYSPRHPKHNVDRERVMALLAREASERERGTLVSAGRALERPGSRNWAMPKDMSAPDAQRLYVPAPGPDHVLHKAFHDKKKISFQQFSAANDYRILWVSTYEVASGSGDSTQALMIDGGKPNYEARIVSLSGDPASRRELSEIHRALGRESAAILFCICGLGHEVGGTVRAVTPKVHPNGVWGRFEEAIDALHDVIRPRDARKHA